MTRLIVAVSALAAALAACGGGGTAAPSPDPGGSVKFPAPGGPGVSGEIQLEGRIENPGRRDAVIFAHELPASQDAWTSYAGEIAAKGFTTLTFNFRGYGLSEGTRDPARAADDLRAAIREMARRGAQSVFLVGASMGGTAAVLNASEQGVAAIVTVSAPEEIQALDATGVAVRAPALFVAGSKDGTAPDAARAFHERATGTRRIEIIEGSSAHGTALLGAPEGGDEVRRLIADFLTAQRV